MNGLSTFIKKIISIKIFKCVGKLIFAWIIFPYTKIVTCVFIEVSILNLNNWKSFVTIILCTNFVW